MDSTVFQIRRDESQYRCNYSLLDHRHWSLSQRSPANIQAQNLWLRGSAQYSWSYPENAIPPFRVYPWFDEWSTTDCIRHRPFARHYCRTEQATRQLASYLFLQNSFLIFISLHMLATIPWSAKLRSDPSLKWCVFSWPLQFNHRYPWACICGFSQFRPSLLWHQSSLAGLWWAFFRYSRISGPPRSLRVLLCRLGWSSGTASTNQPLFGKSFYTSSKCQWNARERTWVDKSTHCVVQSVPRHCSSVSDRLVARALSTATHSAVIPWSCSNHLEFPLHSDFFNIESPFDSRHLMTFIFIFFK